MADDEENTIDTDEDIADLVSEDTLDEDVTDVDSLDKYKEDLADVLGYAKQISGRLEVLVPSLLDTADATNSAADVSRRASLTLEKGLSQVQKRVQELDEASAKSNKLSGYILIGAVTILVISVGIFSFMAQQLNAKTNEVNGMLVALSQRVVNMNSALSLFDEINQTMNGLAVEQSAFTDTQNGLIETVRNVERLAVSMKSDVPAAAALRVSQSNSKVFEQVNQLSISVKNQSATVANVTTSVASLATQVKSMQAQVNNVKALNADVQSLITLERAKYIDVLKRQVALEETRSREEEPEVDVMPSIVTFPNRPIQR
ncbi:MAG TPA: hypothetical protein DD440_02535 [Porticoccaceae bacterium]|nr:hypothetical protein [Porticoccaceae bacterium]